LAVTLLQQAIDQRVDPMEGSIIQLFDQISPIVRNAPAVPTDELYDDYEQETVLPTVAWRGLNEPWPESSGQTALYREYVKFVGGEVKIDVELVRGPRGPRTIERQTKMKVRAAANELDRAVLEGSELNNVKEMVGFRARIQTGNQLILAGSGGATLTLAMLDNLIDAVPFSNQSWPGMLRGEGVTKMLYMNRTLRRKLTSLINASTGAQRITQTLDQFGRQVEKYGDAIIGVVEESGTGLTNLGFDEDPGDAVADTASIYCVAWSDELAHLVYRRPSNDGEPGSGQMLKVFRVDEMEAEPRMLLRFSGGFGLEVPHPRAVARLYGITNT
jgi:hypothetical protein